MQLRTWYPFRSVDEVLGRNSPNLWSQLPEIFGDNGHAANRWAPSADISETKKEFLIKAELPDVEKSDIHVSVEDGQLIIHGERKRHEEEQDETLHRVESFYGTFSRSFVLPPNIDASKITAKSKNGILRVHLPKTEGSDPEKLVEIKID